MFKNVLVPTDGSALSRKAIRNAVRLAKEQKAKVTAIYVSPPYTPVSGEAMAVVHFETEKTYTNRINAIARRILGFVQEQASTAGVRCESIHASSDFPHQEIVRAAGAENAISYTWRPTGAAECRGLSSEARRARSLR